MTIGVVGRKSGMTRVFTEEGVSVPVTVVEVAPNRVTQIKELETDGYRAIQVTAGSRRNIVYRKRSKGILPRQECAGSMVFGNSVWKTWESLAIGAELSVEPVRSRSNC